MSAPVPISLTTVQNDLFDLKKKYYLPPLMYLTIFNNIKKPIEDGEADFNMKKDRAIADFKKTSLYSIYYEIFDEALNNSDYSDICYPNNYDGIDNFGRIMCSESINVNGNTIKVSTQLSNINSKEELFTHHDINAVQNIKHFTKK